MYAPNKPNKTNIKRNTSYEGESIEQKINRITVNKEPITDGAPLIYTDRKDGVTPDTNIRTDRFEVAVEAMDKVAKTNIAKRAQKADIKPEEKATETQTGASTTPTKTESKA